MPGGEGQEVKEEKTLNQKAQDTLQEYLDKKELRDVGYKKIYGTNPTLFQVFPEKERKEVENMKVELPPDLSEEEFMTVVMGAMSADERMNDRLTSSSKFGDDYTFNHTFMTDNLTRESGDDRFSEFEQVVVDGRKKAIEAVEKYKKTGDKSDILKYQESFLEGMKTQLSLQNGKDNEIQRMDLYALVMAGRILQKPEFKDKYRDNALINMSNTDKVLNLSEQSIRKKKELLDNVPPKNSKEREEPLVDIVLTAYIAKHQKEKQQAIMQNLKTETQKYEQIKQNSISEIKAKSDVFLTHQKYKDQEVPSDSDIQKVREKIDQIDEFFDVLDGADSSFMNLFAGNQEKFAAVKQSLKELKEFSKTMDLTPGSEDFNTYIGLSKKAEEATKDYLDYKKEHHTDSKYEKKRIRAVDQVYHPLTFKRKSIQAWNEKGVDKEFTRQKEETNIEAKKIVRNGDIAQKTEEDAKKLVDHYKTNIQSKSIFDSNVKKVFYDGDLSKIPGHSFSSDRAAVVSIAIAAMAATGKYSLEDLQDPSKLTDEKRKMGEEVVGHLTGNTYEDRKWLAGNIIEGQKVFLKMTEDFCQTHDIFAKGFEMTPEFGKLLFMQDVLFDTYQEMAHCEKEGDDYLKEKYPEAPIQSASEFVRDIQGKVRPLIPLTRNVNTAMKNLETFTDKGKFLVDNVKIMMERQLMKDALQQKQLANPDKKITELMTDQEVEQELFREVFAFEKFGKKLASAFQQKMKVSDGIDMAHAYGMQVMDGSLFEGLKADKEGTVFENYPTPAKLKVKYEYDAVCENKQEHELIGRKNLETIYAQKDNLVGKGALGVYDILGDDSTRLGNTIGIHMYTDKKPEYKKVVKDYVKEQMALNLCLKYPDRFKNNTTEEILKGVEKFEGYQKLEKQIDKMEVEEVFQLWKKDVTAPIIEKTLDRQMKELEKKNDQAVNIKETGAKKENQRENQQEFNLMV